MLTQNDTLELVVEVFEKLFPNRTWLTAYEVSKALNEASGKNTPPQMMYNYIRQNLIPVSVVEGKKRVQLNDAIAFVTKYTTRNATK